MSVGVILLSAAFAVQAARGMSFARLTVAVAHVSSHILVLYAVIDSLLAEASDGEKERDLRRPPSNLLSRMH